MATPSQAAPVNPDTLITVKVSYNNGIRRFKLPLRDLGPNVLPGKLRTALAIPDGQTVLFERYSDSAGSFIVLDSTVPSVYKQLYRAAKAKLKLRLKATIPSGESGASATPAPPSYSQVSLLCPLPDTPTAAAGPDTPTATGPPTSPATVTAPVAPTVTATPATIATEMDSTKINQVVADAILNYFDSDEYNEKLRRSVCEEVAKQSRAPSSASVSEAEPTLPQNMFPKLLGVPALVSAPSVPTGFLVYCNNCNSSINGSHYHCSSCDGGDFDLCETCIEKGEHCEQNHWLIKRHLKDGQFVTSVTESSYAKPKAQDFQTRTCNCCVISLPEDCFVTCTACEDYDVCLPCHISQKHGHHPLHTFEPATKDTPLDDNARAMLAPGRGVKHHAICDGCDSTIFGVRHKCLTCPDWDFCSACFKDAPEKHAGHRFVPLYETINLFPTSPKAVHTGIYCDGPLCADKPRWIQGDRYHCAICNDVDFCADCEAHPSNQHNRTHPVIKMKTAVRNLTCATQDTTNPTKPSLLGDIRGFKRADLKTTNAATQVQTVADVQPSTEPANLIDVETPTQVVPKEVTSLEAEYVSDTVDDGTVMTPGQKFSQTWTLKNTGRTTWPAGVSVRFVGGDSMFGSEDDNEFGRNIILDEVAVGDSTNFTVNLVAPEFPRRRVISYWRLTAPDGQRFGHKLWCDIEVEKVIKEESMDDAAPIAAVVKEEMDSSADEETVKGEEDMDNSISSTSSQMVFPKLEKESIITEREANSASSATDESATETDGETLPATSSAMHSPAWTLTMSEGEDHTSDPATSEDDVESLMLDDEDYEVLETSDDDGYNRVI